MHLFVAGLLMQTSATLAPSAPSPSSQVAASAPKEGNVDGAALLSVKRIYVDSFGEDVIARELQSTIVSSLIKSKRFKVTENRERADAILKGVALEKSPQELHAYGEGTAVGRSAISDSSLHTETLNEAKVSIRLVALDGDVIWTTTQESKGGKYKGASADVADKCVKQLLRDLEALENAGKAAAPFTQSPTAGEATHK